MCVVVVLRRRDGLIDWLHRFTCVGGCVYVCVYACVGVCVCRADLSFPRARMRFTCVGVWVCVCMHARVCVCVCNIRLGQL